MVPHAVLFANVSYGVLVIEAAHDSRASDRVDEERLVTFGYFVLNHGLKCYGVHLSCEPVTWYLSHLIHTHSGNHCSAVNTVVTLSRRKGNRAIFWLPAFHAHVWKVLMTGRQECHHVAHGSAWVHRTIDLVLGYSELLPKDADTLDLHG